MNRSSILAPAVICCIAVTLVAAEASACLVLGDFFRYADGSSLAGQDGGREDLSAQWTTPWQPVGTTPTGGFAVAAGKPSVGDTGSSTYQISRGMDLSTVPRLQENIFFTAELTQVIDNHSDYSASVVFSDATGTTAAFGIEDDKFFGTLGTNKVINPSLNVASDIFYWMYGQLDFNYSGSDERLRVWVNPMYSDIANGTNVAVQIIDDLGSEGGQQRLALGNAVSLVANTSQAGTAKTWDDLTIGGGAHSHLGIGFPRIDVGQSSGNQHPGFEQWALGSMPQHSFTMNLDQTEYGGSDGEWELTLTLEAIESAENLQPVQQTLLPGLADDLREDGVEALGGIQLTLSGLFPDGYLLKTYHHQTAVGALDPDIDVWVSNDGGSSFALAESFTPATETDPATELYIQIASYTMDDVIIQFIPREDMANVGLNGFVLLPEPGTAAMLLSAGLMGLIALRRRRKRA